MQFAEVEGTVGKTVEEIRLLDDETRTAYVKKERWFPYTRANALLKKIDELMKHPQGFRMPCLAVVGRPNCGKTMLLRQVTSRHPKVPRPLREVSLVPALYVQAPPQADRGELYNAILDALEVPYNPNMKPPLKLKIILHVLRQVQIKIILIDEVNQSVYANKKQIETFLSSIKHLSNELMIPIVLGGTPVVGAIIKNDDQFASRFKVEVLKVWPLDNAFLRLLQTLSERTILRKPVDLATPELAPLIHGMAEGYLGEVVWLIRDASVKAIETGLETITPELLRSLDWTPPSARKRELGNQL
jgi:hypothetical protein